MNRIFLPATALLLSAGMLARADVKYLQETLIPGQNGGKPFSTTTIYKTKGAERSEMSMAMGAATFRTVTITSCAKKQLITLDDSLKIYTAEPLFPITQASKPAPKASGAKAKTGTITMTLISLRALPSETINGAKTPVYEVKMRMQTSGCLGASDRTMTQQIAYGVATGGAGGGDGCSNMSPGGGGGADACSTRFVRRGDWSRYDKITRGVPVRTRVLDGGKVSSETRSSNVSRAKLPGSLFVVPAGYKKVTSAEFQAARQKAMMEAMSAGANADAKE